MGCLFRMIGIAVLVVVLLVAGWIYRDDIRRWVGRDSPAPVATAEPDWEPLTSAGAARARAIVARLERRSGRVYENVRPADLSALVFEELSRQALPPSAQDVEAAVIGDRLYIRADVKLSDFGGREALGALARLLSDRERVQFGGSLQVVRPGLAQYRIEELRVGNLDVPPPLIPKLIGRIDSGARPEGIDSNALPLEIPEYIADVRIGEGMVTLIKAAE